MPEKKEKGEKIANKMVMLNAGFHDFCHIPMPNTLVPDALKMPCE